MSFLSVFPLFKFSRLISAGCCCCFLQACSSSAYLPLQDDPDENPLADIAWILSADPVQLAAEQQRLGEIADDAFSPADHLRFAILLGESNHPAAMEEAIGLLQSLQDGIDSSPNATTQKILVSHWQRYLQLKVQLMAAMEEQARMSSEYQELQNEHQVLEKLMLRQGELMVTMEKNVVLQERQSALLQQQLQALTAIERQLMEGGTTGNEEE